MRVLVTGATGLVGGNLVRELVRQQYDVRALVRRDSDARQIADLAIERMEGDLLDLESLRRAMRGCQALFHVGALYSLSRADSERLYRTNVDGTTNVLTAALEGGVERVVFTSSVSTIGFRADGRAADEETTILPQHLVGPYKRSKYLAECEARRFCERGLPVVIVNPSTPIGVGDVKPTPTGRIVLDFIRRRMPAYVNTGLNLIDVEDVAVGHILALRRGRVGERYILGHKDLTLQEIFAILERVSSVPAPRMKMPLAVALAAAYVNEGLWSRLTGKPPSIPIDAVRMAHKHMFFDSSRAVRELGLPQTPIEDALAKAVSWFRQNGYA